MDNQTRNDLSGVVMMLPASQLNIDWATNGGYQRPLKEPWLKWLYTHFDSDQVRPLMVSQRADGTLWVYDGQHTMRTLQKVYGNDVICKCLVRTGLTRDDERRLFLALNKNQKRVPAMATFQAELAGNDPMHVAINDIVRKNGMELCENVHKTSRWKLASPDALKTIYKQYGGETLDKALSIIGEAWNGEYESLKNPMVKGMALFVYKMSEDYNRKNLVDKLQRTPCTDIVRAAKAATIGSEPKRYARAIGDVYNSGKTRKRVDLSKL